MTGQSSVRGLTLIELGIAIECGYTGRLMIEQNSVRATLWILDHPRPCPKVWGDRGDGFSPPRLKLIVDETPLF